jgi:hypothetical protein
MHRSCPIRIRPRSRRRVWWLVCGHLTSSAGFDRGQKKDWQLLNEQLQGVEAEQNAVIADAVRYQPRATNPGILRDIDPDIKFGMWLAQRELVGRVISPSLYQVVSYVDDGDVQRISVGDRGLCLLLMEWPGLTTILRSQALIRMLVGFSKKASWRVYLEEVFKSERGTEHYLPSEQFIVWC